MGRYGLRVVALGYLTLILIAPLAMMVWRTAEDLDLLTRMASDDERQRAAGYMHGLSELKREWKKPKKKRAQKTS